MSFQTPRGDHLNTGGIHIYAGRGDRLTTEAHSPLRPRELQWGVISNHALLKLGSACELLSLDPKSTRTLNIMIRKLTLRSAEEEGSGLGSPQAPMSFNGA